MVRPCGVLYILTWKCASRHNGVQFFITHLASWLRTRRFSEPTFRPSGATNHWKNTVNRDFPTFSRIYIFFLLIFSLLTLLTSAFQLSILSEVSLLNFLRLYAMDELNYTTIAYIYIHTHIIHIYIYIYINIITSQKIAQTSGVMYISWDLSTLSGTGPGDFSHSHSDGRAEPGESTLLFRRPREKTTAAPVKFGWNF